MKFTQAAGEHQTLLHLFDSDGSDVAYFCLKNKPPDLLKIQLQSRIRTHCGVGFLHRLRPQSIIDMVSVNMNDLLSLDDNKLSNSFLHIWLLSE